MIQPLLARLALVCRASTRPLKNDPKNQRNWLTTGTLSLSRALLLSRLILAASIAMSAVLHANDRIEI
ncbi:hypothetical protein PSQ19_08495 [Devosia algicola]|uniref:Uncharacterized protein n=1 Tax=Devosia algicola TaxID=3026418 RepID=A0ABY7YRT0_9HYPH|nr:hypothetical protein [Devosia algicola]WDR04034.1 hypothetical protein PSQ19_08495 [Devosia algicola]